MGLRERLHDLTKTPTEHQAESLREQSETAGGDDLTALALRHPACVCGTVRTVTLPPRAEKTGRRVAVDCGGVTRTPCSGQETDGCDHYPAQ